MVDADHVETTLNNLVENAMKYSREEKEINVKVQKKGNSVAISVTDKGTGIPKNSLKYVFDKFYRVEDSLTAKTKGHGLGLSIVKNMVELNGGTIDVKSEYGKGSTFTVKFPTLMSSNEVTDTAAPTRKKDFIKKEKVGTDV
jgi:signal transduction histidine kinase